MDYALVSAISIALALTAIFMLLIIGITCLVLYIKELWDDR